MATFRRRCALLSTLAVLCGALIVTQPAAIAAAGPARPERAAATESPAGTPLPRAAAIASSYHPLTPARILDTRENGGHRLSAGEVHVLDVTGVGGVPNVGVDAVVLNVTATNTTASGYLTLFPTGSDRPLASHVNFLARQTVPNVVIARVGADGTVSIYNSAGLTHVVVDVQGWYSDTNSSYHPLVPQRLLDTRELGVGGTPVGPAAAITVDVTDVAGVPETGVDAVVLNITATKPTADGFLTVYPTGEARPLASNVNFVARQTVPNVVIAKVGADGTVSIHNSAGTTHVIVDIQGWYSTTDTPYTPLTPERILDTREIGPDGTPLSPDSAITLDVTDVAGVPSTGVDAVVLNVTATKPTERGYLTVYPTGADRPFASNLNFVAGQTVPNVVIAKVGPDGTVQIYNSAGLTHVVVDIQGWYAETIGGDPVFEGDEYGWRFVPSHMLLSPGETREGQLVQTDLDGMPTGGALPAGVTFQMTGTQGNLTVTSLGGTAIEVTAGDVIDTAVVAAQIPDTALAPVMTVTIANVKDGVVLLDDADIAFPQPNLPHEVKDAAAFSDEYSASGVGPFTWEQIAARVSAPDDTFGGLDEAAMLATVVRYPLVLRGSPPATGSFVLGSGGSAVLGQVVEPDGLPTLVVGGYSLISVQLVGPQMVYDDLFHDLQYDDLVAIGAVPADDMTNPPLPELPPGPSRATHSSPQSLRPLADPPAPDPNAPPTGSQTVAQPGTVTSGGGATVPNASCKEQMLATASGGFAVAQFAPAISLEVTPTINAYVSIVDGDLQGIRLELGGTVKATVSARVTFQPTLALTLDCKLADYLQIEMQAPGPLAALLSITGDLEQHFRLTVQVAGGPKAEPGLSCSASITAIIGFSYDATSGDFQDLRRSDHQDPTCDWDQKVTTNVSSDGVGAWLEVTIGAPIVSPLGVRVGGAVLGTIGAFISFFSGYDFSQIGKVKAVTLEMAPQLRATWENRTNTMSVEAAKSATVAEAVFKAGVDISPVKWLLKLFGVNGGAFSLTAVQLTIPLLNGYQALNPATGGIVAKIGGEDAPIAPAVYVQENDELVLTSTLVPAGGGLSTSLSSAQLTSAEVFERIEGVASPTGLFQVSVVPSSGEWNALGVTTVRLTATITPQVCDQLRDAPHTFLMVGVAPMDFFVAALDVPAWGGKFDLQCVEGKVEWEPTSVSELTKDEPVTATIVSIGPKPDTFEIIGAPSWLTVDPTEGELTGSPSPDSASQTVDVELTINDQPLGACFEPRPTVPLTVKTTHRGSAVLLVNEDDPCMLEWEAPSVTGPGDVTVNLNTKGREADTVVLNSASLPDWLTASPSGETELPATDGATVGIPFTFTIAEREPMCTVQLPRSFEVTVTSSTRGEATLRIIDPKVEPLTGCGLRFTPDHLADSGSSTLTLRDDDFTAGETAAWFIDPATLPDWLTATPANGTIGHEQEVPVFFAVLGSPFDACVGRPQATASVSVTAEVPNGDYTTKTVHGKIAITRAAIPPSDCPITTGAANGDPHMLSMDGVPFEGQIIGEYTYLRTPDGFGDPMELVVRTQPTSGATTSQAPTSVTALALTYRDSKVEVYVAGGAHEVLVDGELVDLADDAPLQVVDGLAVVRSGVTVRIDTPSLTINSARSFWGTHLLNLTLSARVGSPLEGLLGSPDGDLFNDFVGADGTPYTMAAIQANQHPEFYDYVASWRLTDQSASPFTRPFAQFDQPNPGFDPQILADFGDDVDAAMAGAELICDGGLTPQQRYGLAMEFSIGPNVDIGRFICSYGVSGIATSDGAPVAGLKVSMDALGLHSCTSTTGLDGRYFCVLIVDLDEVRAASGPLLPLTVAVTGRWPGLSSVAAAGTAEFTQAASFNAGPPRVETALAVDPDSLPRLQVSGTMHQNGLPLAGTQSFSASAYDAEGALLLTWYQPVEVAVGTGAYQFSRVLPPTATRVTVEATVPWPVQEVFSTELTGLELGPNQRTFDIDYVVPTATVSGTLTNGATALAGPFTVWVVSRNALDAPIASTYGVVTPDPATGGYSFNVALPRAAATVEASVQVGEYGETFRSAVTPVIDALAVVELSGAYAPASVVVSGDHLNELGAPIGTQSQLGVWFFAANGTFLSARSAMVPAGAGDGTYSVTFTAPTDAATVEAFVNAGVVGESFRSARVPITQLTSIDLDVVLDPVRLHVTGTLTDGAGAPLTGTVPMSVQFKDAGGIVVTGQVGSVTPDPITGAYAIDFVGPRQATSAVVTAMVGVNSEAVTADVPVVNNGDNDFVFNVGFSPPVVTFTGRLTGEGGAPLSGPIPIYVGGYDDHYFSVYGQFHYVTPNAQGDYSFTVVMPSSTVLVYANAQVGSIVEWFRTGDLPVVAGSNTVVLNGDYRPSSVTISGVMVSAPGLPLGPPFVPGPISVGITAYNSNGDVVKYTQPAITPGAGGAYTIDVALPTPTASIEVRAFISGENIVQTFGGFGLGVHQDVTFDVTHNPPRLNLSGVALRNGVPATGQVRVEIRAHTSPSTHVDTTRFLTLGAGGSYSAAGVLLPNGTTDADVKVRLADGEQVFSTTAAALSPGEVREVVVDIDEVPTTVTVHGNATAMGDPIQPGSFYVSAYDASNQQLTVANWFVAVTPDANGDYSVTFTVPENTARAVVYTFAGAPGWGSSVYLDHEVLGVTAETDTSSTWDFSVKGVRVTGSLLDDGERVPLDGEAESLAFDVTVHSPDRAVGSSAEAFYEGDDSFLLELLVPDDAESVELTVTNAGPTLPTRVITPLDPVLTEALWDIEIDQSGSTTFVLFGTITDDGVPLQGQPDTTYEIVGYEFVDWSLPYTEVFRQEVTLPISADGTYGVGFTLPASVTMVNATVKVDGADEGWTRGYTDIVVGGDDYRTFDIERGASRLRYRGETILDGCTGPLVFYREFWSFPAEPTEGYDPGGHSWEGGTLIARVLVIPDTTAPYEHDTAVHLPADGTWLGTVLQTYNGVGAGAGPFGPGVFGETTADETVYC